MGPLCDKFGGDAKFTFIGGLGMTARTIVALVFLHPTTINDFYGFSNGMVIIFAFGPFLVGMSLSVMAPRTFFIICTVWYGICTALTWWYYARPNAPTPG